MGSRKKSGKRSPPSFSLFGCTLEGIDRITVKQHLLLIVATSIVAKLVLVFMTVDVFHSFIDTFDVGTIYLKYAVNIAGGQIPYLDFSVEYPPLFFIPVLLPLGPALAAQSGDLYITLFRIIGSILDILIACVVYFIALKLHRSRTALTAGLLYATAFSSAYFSIAYYDAFPVLLLVAGMMYILYSRRTAGYISLILGFFAKVFPAIALPYAAFYRPEGTSLTDEIKRIAIFFIPLLAVLLIPLMLADPSAALKPYVSATGAGFGVYAATVTATLYNILSQVLGIGLPVEALSAVMSVLMIALLLLLFLVGFFFGRSDPRRFCMLVLLTLFVTVFFSRFHSPNYFMWMSPIMALLLCDAGYKILAFYLSQTLVYIQFPLIFGTHWVNLEYVSPPLSPGWYSTLVFFIVEWLVFAAIMFIILREDRELLDLMRSLPARLREISKKPE